MKRKALLILNSFRLIWCALLLHRSKYRDYISEDVKRISGGGTNSASSTCDVCYSLLKDLPFRSVFYYRVSDQKILAAIAKLFIRPLSQIEIYLPPNAIGPGLRILHNTGAVITPYSAGKNLTVGQNVTIGKNSGKEYATGRYSPVIGDDVHIATNAVVIGGITIGNDVIVGAGAVVVSDVPDHSTVAGVPAKIIKRRI